VKDNAWYFDENVVVYPTGDNIVVYDSVRKSQKFINSGLSAASANESLGNKFKC
jgi:hypothetical protein